MLNLGLIALGIAALVIPVGILVILVCLITKKSPTLGLRILLAGGICLLLSFTLCSIGGLSQ